MPNQISFTGREVAPFAGAWIEITALAIGLVSMMSLPSRERGLKSLIDKNLSKEEVVAPFAGAWIEIHGIKCDLMITGVAPFAGAWIEIDLTSPVASSVACRSLRGSVD